MNPEGPTGWQLPESIRELVDSGGEEIVADLIETFRTDTRSRLDRLHAAAAAGDRAIVRAEIHSIKGGCVQMGGMEMVAICQKIEAMPRDVPLPQLQPELVRLEAAFSDLSRAMGQ